MTQRNSYTQPRLHQQHEDLPLFTQPAAPAPEAGFQLRKQQAQAQYDATCAAAFSEYKQLRDQACKDRRHTGWTAYSATEEKLWNAYMATINQAARTLAASIPEWFYQVTP